MKPEVINDRERKFTGISAKTTNAAEADLQTAKIPALWQKYFQAAKDIPNKKGTGRILGVYTDYESDQIGKYTLIVCF